MLARERFFLIMHAALFLATNLIGFFLALKCYLEFIGDPMSKLVMATTPLVFINALSLMFLVPISGTRKQIARLKEELAYIRFQMEYGHLL